MEESRQGVEMINPGTYRHFKGGRYLVLDVATDADTLERVAYYVSLDYGTRWVRKESEFEESVAWPDGKVHHRFIREDFA